MGKKKPVTLPVTNRREQEEELFAEFDAHQDMKAFNSLNRSDPVSAGILVRMIDISITPEKIVAHMLHRYPHLWPQAQMLLAGARYLEAERDG